MRYNKVQFHFHNFKGQMWLLFAIPQCVCCFIVDNLFFRRLKCNKGDGNPPIYVNVNMKTGETLNHWIDSLQAAWTAVQVCAKTRSYFKMSTTGNLMRCRFYEGLCGES